MFDIWTDENNQNMNDEANQPIEFANINIHNVNQVLNYGFDITNSLNRFGNVLIDEIIIKHKEKEYA